MKKMLAIGLFLCTLLCGCTQSDLPGDDHDPTREEMATGDATKDAETLRAQIVYYEQLVGDLQVELLNVKTELYANRVEYEARIAELEAQKTPANGSGSLSKEGDFQYTVRDGVATVTAYIGSETAVEIPATVDGYTVSAIGDRAFMDQLKLKSVTLPKTVTSVGWFAFSGCISLERITVPATVSSISYGAFQNCPSTLQMNCTPGSYADQYARSYGIRAVSVSS